MFQAKTVEEKKLWAHHIKRTIVENHQAIIPQKVRDQKHLHAHMYTHLHAHMYTHLHAHMYIRLHAHLLTSNVLLCVSGQRSHPGDGLHL